MFQHVFAKTSPRTGASEGSCKFLHERFGGKRGSWWIQQRGAMRRARARSATHRHRARRPAPWPRAHMGTRRVTFPWWGRRGARKGVPPLTPQRRRPAGVAQRPRAGPSPRRAAHLHAAGGAADTAHGRAGGIDRRATRRL